MTFAAWGVDYLKYDNCPDPGPNPGPIIQPRFEAMRAALDGTGRPIVFSVCAWSFYEWATRAGHLQRTTTDIKNLWTPDPNSTDRGSIITSLKTNQPLAAYGGPNQWNDPDMLEVGNSDNGAGPVTDVENQSHFSLWAIMRVAADRGQRPAQHERGDQGDPDQQGDHRDQPGRDGPAGRVDEADRRAVDLGEAAQRQRRARGRAAQRGGDRRRHHRPLRRDRASRRRRDGARSAGEGGQGIVQRQLHGQRPFPRHRDAEDRRRRAATARAGRRSSAT